MDKKALYRASIPVLIQGSCVMLKAQTGRLQCATKEFATKLPDSELNKQWQLT